MSDYLTFALLCLTSFFSVINPLGVMPVFLTMTADLDERNRNRTARKAALVAFVTMCLFALSGKLLFDFFGISVDSFRVVGGIIFLMMGYEMLQARLSRIEIDEESVHKYVEDISITPLGIPMICGPGAITTSIVLMQDARTVELKLILIIVMALICVITMIALMGAGKFTKLLGETGIKIMTRLMGLIIMVIAIEFFIAGLGPIVKRMMAP